MQTVRSVIYQMIIDKLGIDETTLNDNASFFNDLAVDSLDFLELIVDIEKEFNIVIDEERYEKIKVVGALIKLVEETADKEVVETT